MLREMAMDWIILNRQFSRRTSKGVDGCKGVRIYYRVSRSWTLRLGKRQRQRQKQRRILLRRMLGVNSKSKSKSKSKSRQDHQKRGETSSSMCSTGGDIPIPWTDFPTEDFAGTLLERLPLHDYLNFGAVCKTWRSLQARVPYGRFIPPSPPPCFIPYNAGGHETMPCFSPFDQRHGTLGSRKGIPWAQRIIINPTGTCHPYIIALRPSCDLLRITLLNPISGHEITLPGNPISWSDFEEGPRFLLSLSHSSPPRYTVFITFEDVLMFYREGDRDRTLLNLPWLVYNFNTFRGDLYALSESEGARYLLAVYSTHPAPSIHEFVMDTSQLPSPASMIRQFSVPHLVESPNGEELLLVLEIRTLEDWYSSTVGFQVFKADLSRKTWIRKDETLGDRVLIIRGQQSLFLSPASVGHGVKGNCIYFSRIYDETGQTPLQMFDLDSKTMSDVSIPFPSNSGLVMFVPNIC